MIMRHNIREWKTCSLHILHFNVDSKYKAAKRTRLKDEFQRLVPLRLPLGICKETVVIYLLVSGCSGGGSSGVVAAVHESNFYSVRRVECGKQHSKRFMTIIQKQRVIFCKRKKVKRKRENRK